MPSCNGRVIHLPILTYLASVWWAPSVCQSMFYVLFVFCMLWTLRQGPCFHFMAGTLWGRTVSERMTDNQRMKKQRKYAFVMRSLLKIKVGYQIASVREGSLDWFRKVSLSLAHVKVPGPTLESPGEEWSRQRAGSPRDLPYRRACVLQEK